MTKLEQLNENEKMEKELFRKYIDLIGFMEYTKLNPKAVVNFLYLHYEIVARFQEDFEESEFYL